MADLATPAGIDRDYNYLTSIERELDRADQDTETRGIQLFDGMGQPSKKKGRPGLKAGIERAGAIVQRAPTGMSRSNTNDTHWLKGSQCMEWTVEWIHPDGMKELGQCREDEAVAKVYKALLQAKPRKRRRGAQKHHQSGSKKQRSNKTNISDSPCQKTSIKETTEELGIEDANLDSIAKLEGKMLPKMETEGKAAFDNKKVAPPSPLSADANKCFYLHTPCLPSKQTVVTQLNPSDTLSTCLRLRVVLEYPTIYVLKKSHADLLPDTFITEAEHYNNARKEKIEELEDGEVEEIQPVYQQEEHSIFEKMNEKKLLDVLGMDLRRIC